MFQRFTLAALAALALGTAALAGTLGLGDPAPAITVGKWVKGQPVTAFEKDKVYVVEFWATWCGPCKTSIPHVTELQKKYADQVTVIGVSVWENDWTAVEPFVEKMGDKMAYRVAVDQTVESGRDGKMSEAWMRAAERGGIPSAFIVDKAGKVAWVGHPMQMDDPLAKIVAGTWDIAAAKVVQEREQRLQKALRGKDPAAALAAIEETIAADPKSEERYGMTKFDILMSQDAEKAGAYGKRLVEVVYAKDANALNMIAWRMVDPRAKTTGKPDLDLALRSAKAAEQMTESKEPSVLDTLARVHFARGSIDDAIAVQTRAVELAKGEKLEAELAERLTEYQAAKSGGKN